MSTVKQYPIPEDLRRVHHQATERARVAASDVLPLIERIAKAEGQLAEARAVLVRIKAPLKVEEEQLFNMDNVVHGSKYAFKKLMQVRAALNASAPEAES